METLIAFVIASAVTFYFVRKYVKGLSDPKPQAATSISTAGPTDSCPRCGKGVPRGMSFCGSCGAPLELWKVQRASVSQQKSGDGQQGAPRPVINASLCIACGTCVEVCPEPGTLALVDGKAILANPESCTGHAKCKDVCPTSAITLAFGDVLQTVSVPLVNEHFETNVPGIFIVGELGGMGLIKTAINEGRLVVDYIKRNLEATKPPSTGSNGGHALSSNGDVVDLLIVGAGPAGLSASLTAQQYGLSYRTFDQGEVASTIRQYPRHKFLMAEPVSMPLYGNLYIADGTKESLVSVWENIITNTGVQVGTNERAENVTRNGVGFEVETSKGKYHARHVVLAMGKRGTPRRLDVPGEDLAKVTYRLIEAETYEDKDILVVGGGDSAVEAALALSREARNRVTLSYRKDDFSRARERNQAFLADAQKEGRLTILRSSTVAEVRPDLAILDTKEGQRELPNDFVFVMIGGVSPEGFLRKTGVEIVEKTVTT